MGWTYTFKPDNQTIKDFFTKEFTQNGEERVLDCALVNRRTAYLAYRCNDGRVAAVVCLLDYRPKSYYNFGYKDIGEDCGPCESKCPERILSMLSPTDDQYAVEWRKRCQENLFKKKSAPKVKRGDTVLFKGGILFSGGLKVAIFTVLNPRSSVFADSHGGLFRIPNWKTRDFEIVERKGA